MLITNKQRQVLRFLMNNGNATLMDIAKELGLRNASTPHFHVSKLIEKNFISKSGKSRGVVYMITESGENALKTKNPKHTNVKLKNKITKLIAELEDLKSLI